MSKSKTSKPKYAPIIETPPDPRTTVRAEPPEAAERQRSQAPDHGAEGEQRVHNMMKDHACCYDQCLKEGTIHIGVNGGDSHWICWRHLNRWNQTRARLISDGGGCAMQELGELLCATCWHEVSKRT